MPFPLNQAAWPESDLWYIAEAMTHLERDPNPLIAMIATILRVLTLHIKALEDAAPAVNHH